MKLKKLREKQRLLTKQCFQAVKICAYSPKLAKRVYVKAGAILYSTNANSSLKIDRRMLSKATDLKTTSKPEAQSSSYKNATATMEVRSLFHYRLYTIPKSN